MNKHNGLLLRFFLFVWCFLLPPLLSHATPTKRPSQHFQQTLIPTQHKNATKQLAMFGAFKHTKQKVQLGIKLIYAHVRNKPYVDKHLKHDVPSLRQMFDFNAYQLLTTHMHQTSYKSPVTIAISERYRLTIIPQKYLKKKNYIVLQAIFLRWRKGTQNKHSLRKKSTQNKQDNSKKTIKNKQLHNNKSTQNKHSFFQQYASTRIKLTNNNKIAFLGPTYRYGRILIILRMKHF